MKTRAGLEARGLGFRPHVVFFFVGRPTMRRATSSFASRVAATAAAFGGTSVVVTDDPGAALGRELIPSGAPSSDTEGGASTIT
jgi:hypothetical protein